MTIQSIWLYGMILLLSWLLVWFTSWIRVVANGYNFRWMASFSVGKRTNKNLLFWFVLENFIFGVKYIRYAFVAFLVLFAASELGIICMTTNNFDKTETLQFLISRPEKNDSHFAGSISNAFSNYHTSIQISLKFVPNDPINNMSALVPWGPSQ